MNQLILAAIIYLYGSCDTLKYEMEAHGIQSIYDLYEPETAQLISETCEIN